MKTRNEEIIDHFDVTDWHFSDYPDYPDAYISNAVTKEGRILSAKEIKDLEKDYPGWKIVYINSFFLNKYLL